MNAQELFTASGKPAAVFYCEKCRLVTKNREAAEQCCRCHFCGETVEKGGDDFASSHYVCWRLHQDEHIQKRMDEAELVEDYDGPLYSPDGYGNDGYIFDVEHMAEILVESVESPEDWPEFMFCCGASPVQLDLYHIVDFVTDDMPEEVTDDVVIPDALHAGIKEFNDVNADLKVYTPDFTRKVRIPRPPADLFDGAECICDSLTLANAGCQCRT